MDDLRRDTNGHGPEPAGHRASSWLREAVNFIRASASPFAMWRYLRRLFRERPTAGLLAAAAMVGVLLLRRRARQHRQLAPI